MGPESAPVVVTNPNFVRILSTSSKGDVLPATTSSASQVISAADGGVVSNGRVTLEFPAGALDQDTEISIQMLDDGTLGVWLEPHGIQFNKPVVMTMDLAGTTAEGMGDLAETLWWNEDAGHWEQMEKVTGGTDEDRALLWHFCKFTDAVGG